MGIRTNVQNEVRIYAGFVKWPNRKYKTLSESGKRHKWSAGCADMRP